MHFLLALIDDRSYINFMARLRKSEHIKEKLLTQGIELLKEHGYHGTGLKKILDQVNVPKGSFYNFFESKEKYVAQVIERYSRTMIGQLDQYLETTDDDPLTCIKNIYYFSIKMLEEDGCQGCLIGNLAAEIGNSSNDCQQAMIQSYDELKKRYEVLIEKAQEQNLIRKDVPPDILADIIWNTWQGALLQMKIKGETDPLKQVIDVAIGVLLK